MARTITATRKAFKNPNLFDVKEIWDMVKDYGDIPMRINGTIKVLICTDSGLQVSDFGVFTCSKCGCYDMDDARVFQLEDGHTVNCPECNAVYKD